VSVTTETGLTRRFQVLPAFLFCRVPDCRELSHPFSGGGDLHDQARVHYEATGHQVAVRQATEVIWGGPPIPERTYDVRPARGRDGHPRALLGEAVTGDRVNELLDEHGADLEITVHPDVAMAPSAPGPETPQE
jgi:hypothetical protein